MKLKKSTRRAKIKSKAKSKNIKTSQADRSNKPFFIDRDGNIHYYHTKRLLPRYELTPQDLLHLQTPGIRLCVDCGRPTGNWCDPCEGIPPSLYPPYPNRPFCTKCEEVNKVCRFCRVD